MLKPRTFYLENINGGNRFKNGDVVTPEAINAPIEASAYAQSIATNEPDISGIDGTGTPSVSIVTDEKGARLRFANLRGRQGLKGEKGDSGLAEGATLSNEYGESDENGYTQKYINEKIGSSSGGYRPNLLLNSNFRIMQRRIDLGSISFEKGYYFDRWIATYPESITTNFDGEGYVDFYAYSANGGLKQIVPDLSSRDFTFSVKVMGLSNYDEEIEIGLVTIDENEVVYMEHFETIEINNTPKIYSFTATHYHGSSSKGNLAAVIRAKSAGQGFRIYWAKLETGSSASDYIAPDPTEELIKCKRYFQVIGMNNVANTLLCPTTEGVVSVKVLFEEMRHRPTISLDAEYGNFEIEIHSLSNGENLLIGSSPHITAWTSGAYLEVPDTEAKFSQLYLILPQSSYLYLDCDAEVYSYYE